MKRLKFSIALVCLYTLASAQPERIKSIFPDNTIIHQNINYANDTLKKHMLDIYLPANATNVPLVIWIHGGAWQTNNKYGDMGYMKVTIRSFLENGFGLASIDHRPTTTAVFPAQIQDCIQGVQWLYDHATQYHIDKNKLVLIGFSSGGHLASLLGTSLNNNVTDFYPNGKKPSFKLRAVLDFYGPSDLLLAAGNALPTDPESPISTLLGASPMLRPDLAKKASPATYVDKNDPPFFIVNGEKDESVPPVQSYLLKSWFDLAGAKSELIIVEGAPHFGEMFDADIVRLKLLAFLKEQVK